MFLSDVVAGVEASRQIPAVRAGMKQIDDRKGAGKILAGKVPDPRGAVSPPDLLFRAAPAAIPGFQIDPLAELAGGLDRAGRGRGVRIADRLAFCIPLRRGEGAAPLALARVGGLSVHFAGPARGLFFDQGYSGAVPLHLPEGKGFSHDGRQIQLHGAVQVCLLAPRDVAADGLRRTFHGWGAHFPTRRQFDLLASVVARSLRTHHRQQAPHAGRQILALDIPFGVKGEWPVRAGGAQLVRTPEFHLAPRGEEAPGAQLAITCGRTAGASPFPLVRAGSLAWPPATPGHCASRRQGRPPGPLHGFQIQLAALAAIRKDHLQPPPYFARDFRLDRRGRFFSSGAAAASARGRPRQIRVLISTNRWLSCWNFRNSATSRSALPSAAGRGRASVTVLPASL